jgi:Gametolysin peptidase M11
MLHSGKGNNEYGDQSGLMGYSYGQGNAPAMCFNGAKHAHLGWYDDRTAIVNPSNGAWNGTIAAFVDYAITSKTQFVIVIVGDIYLQYNRATKFNAGVKEKRNTITITRAIDLKSTSLSLAGLNSGESFLIANYTGTLGLIIEVCQLVYGTNGLSPDYALVSVYLDTFNSTCGKIQSPRPTMSPTRLSTIPQASPNSNKAPTRLPTLFPTKSQTKSPTRLPTLSPTLFTTQSPTRLPTRFPSKSPSRDPTSSPTNFPSKTLIKALTGKSTRSLTWSPSHSPTLAPTHPTMILAISTISPLVSSPTSAIPSSVNLTSMPSSTWAPSINLSSETSNTPSIWQSIPSFRSHQGCNTDEILLQLSITTSDYPGETYWTLKDASVALMTGGPYTQQNDTHNISNCIPDEEYLFIIQTTHKDGFGESGHYTLTVNDIILQSGKEFLNYSETVILPECLMGTSRCTVDVTTGVIGSQNSFIVEDFDGNTLMSGSGYGPYEYRSKASCIADSACIKVVFESPGEIGTLNNLSVWYNGTNFSTSFDDGRRESAYIGSSCGVALVASN